MSRVGHLVCRPVAEFRAPHAKTLAALDIAEVEH